MDPTVFVTFASNLYHSFNTAVYHIIIVFIVAAGELLSGFLMNLPVLMSFASNLCDSVYIAFYYVIISFVAVGQFLCSFLCHGLIGVTAAFNYVPTCNDNVFTCTLKALLVFRLELGKSFDGFGVKTKPYQILIFLAVIFIPFLREIVAACLAFILSFIFTILIQVFNLSQNRRVRRTFVVGDGNEPLQWSDIFKSFKRLFTRFKLSPGNPRKFYSNTKKNESFKEQALTCLICYENPKCVLLLPCKHACLCVECTNSLMKWRKPTLCPLCRKPVTSSMQIYI